jgi:transposase
MIAVGVDTHKHEHLARALDGLGQLVGGMTIKAAPAGYRELAKWLSGLGGDVVVGIEGTGTYGAGLLRTTACAGPGAMG